MADMNLWLIAVPALMLGLVPCGIVVVRRKALDQLVALELGSVLATLILLLLAVGSGRSSFSDLALTLAVLSTPGSLAFARLLGLKQ